MISVLIEHLSFICRQEPELEEGKVESKSFKMLKKSFFSPQLKICRQAYFLLMRAMAERLLP
jgi:hypothetical protein